MGLLTGAGLDKILRKIMESGELTDELANSVQSIRDDFNARNEILSQFGDVYSGDDVDEFDFVINEQSNAYTTGEGEVASATEWETKYNDLKAQYLDRFFNGNSSGIVDIMEETIDDVQDDGEVKTFDELLEGVED